MERTDILALMGELKLYGMRTAYDEVMAAGIKRQHEPPRIVGDLLKAEIAEKQARSIKYQMTISKLPLAKDLDGFEFAGTPINEALVRDLSNGGFLAEQRNAVLIGGTGTGKSHLAIAIARACIRSGARGRFYNVVDLVNRLDSEARAGRQGRMADYLSRLDFLILDERCQNDDGAPRPPHASLRDRGDWQRELAVQTPRLTSNGLPPPAQPIMPPCSRPSRTSPVRAAAEERPFLTAAPRACSSHAWAGTEGWHL